MRELISFWTLMLALIAVLLSTSCGPSTAETPVASEEPSMTIDEALDAGMLEIDRRQFEIWNEDWTRIVRVIYECHGGWWDDLIEDVQVECVYQAYPSYRPEG